MSMEESKGEEKRFSLFRRKSTKKDYGGRGYSGAVPIGARLATSHERSATLPSHSSAQAAGHTAMTQSPSGGLFSKLKRRFRLRSSRGKYDLKDYDRPQRIRRKSDDPLRSEEQSDLAGASNVDRVTSSVKTPRRSQSDKENVILIRKDKCVSVICQDANGGSEVIFSNMPSTEDNSDSISEPWEEAGEEDPYATINSVKEEIQERFFPNGNKDSSDIASKRERDRVRAKQLLQYSVASSANASAATTPNGVSTGKPSKIECVNVEDLYAKINSKNKTKRAETSPDTPPGSELKGDEQKCDDLNKFVEAQIRCRQDHEYETLEDVRMRASELFENSEMTMSSSENMANEHGVTGGDTSDGSGEIEIEPDYETLEDVRQRVSVALSSPMSNNGSDDAHDDAVLNGSEAATFSNQESHKLPSTPTTNLLDAPSSTSTPSGSSPSPSKSPTLPSSGVMAPLAPSIDVEMRPSKNTKESSSSSSSLSPSSGSDCIYDNPNVILRKQFFRYSMGGNLNPPAHHRQHLTLSDTSSLTTTATTRKSSTQADEDLIEKLSSKLAPPLPLRMYQKDEVGGIGKGRAGGGGVRSRHSWSAHSSTPKTWDMSGSWHAGMEPPPAPAASSKDPISETEGSNRSGVVRSRSHEVFDESKEDNIIVECSNGLDVESESDTKKMNSIDVEKSESLLHENGQIADVSEMENNNKEMLNEEEKDTLVELNNIISVPKQAMNLKDISEEANSIEKLSESRTGMPADAHATSFVVESDDYILNVSCSQDINFPTAKTPSALDIDSSQSITARSTDEIQVVGGIEKGGLFQDNAACNSNSNRNSFHSIDAGDILAKESQSQSSTLGDVLENELDSSKEFNSDQKSVHELLTGADGGMAENQSSETTDKSVVCLRLKPENSAVGTTEWKMRRKSGPNASASQDMAEMSLAFEHGEFLSGFTEQYKEEEEEEEDVIAGFGEVDETSKRGVLLPMSEIVSLPSTMKTRLLGCGERPAPICGCEDFEDCVCDERCEDGDSQSFILDSGKDNGAPSHSSTKDALTSQSITLVDTSLSIYSDERHDKTRDIEPAVASEVTIVKEIQEKNEDAKETSCTDSVLSIYRSYDIAKKNSIVSNIITSGRDSNLVQTQPSRAMVLKQCPEIPWENLICQTPYKAVNPSLYNLSTHQSDGLELATQTVTSQHEENQKLFLRMLRLLENAINGFCQHWMGIDLSYLLTGVFKWSRCFNLPPEDFLVVEQKLKRLLVQERDKVFSRWNVMPNKFYERRREKFQEDTDSIYQKIRNILTMSEGLPTFQNVRLNLLGCFLLHYEVKWPFCLSALVEHELLRISHEDLSLLMQNLSSDNWTDNGRYGLDCCKTCNSDPLLSTQCCCCCCGDNQNQSQQQSMQLITLDSSCQISPQRDFSDPFLSSNMSSPTSVSDFSPTEPDDKIATFSSPSKVRKSGILNEFLNMCDSVGENGESSDEEDENDTISTYIQIVTHTNDAEHSHIASVHDDVASLSLCRVFHGELAYTTRIRKSSQRRDNKRSEPPSCVSKRNHLSNSSWQEIDHLMRKLIPPMSPRLDFQFLLRTYAEFKFFILKERQRRKNSRCFGRHCFQIETEDGPRCCREEEMVFMKLIRDELQHFASVIRWSSASESLFVEDRDVSYSLTRLLSITLTTLSKMKDSGRRLSSLRRSRSSSHSVEDGGQKLDDAVVSSSPSHEEGSSLAVVSNNDKNNTGTTTDPDLSLLHPAMAVGEECMVVAKEEAVACCVETSVNVVVDVDDENDVDKDEDRAEEDDKDFRNDDGQDKCCVTPREKAEFHIENYRSFRAGCMWSDLDAWQTPDAFLDDPNILDRTMGGSFCVDRDTNATLHSHTTWGHYEEPKPLQERDDFLESMQQLQMKDWYWGPLSYEQAASVLKHYEDGSFLVRDSSDRKYLLSLSFKSLGEVYHTRIEHAKGLFSFWSQPDSHGKARICEFIEKSVQNSHDGKFLYFLSPSNHGNPPLPIRLLTPVSRNATIPSLRHLSRFVIRQQVRRDHIDFLPVPRMVKGYLRQKQVYVELRDKRRWSVRPEDLPPQSS